MQITLGIEEELMLVDAHSGEAIANPAEEIFEQASRRAHPHRVVREFLKAQMETNSKVCGSVPELAQSLTETRRAAIGAAEAHGAGVIACSTHPWARWQSQQVTEKERYRQAAAAMQDSVRQFFIGGMHIHAGFGDAKLRIAVMQTLIPHLPLLLALSTSSPFHEGRLTGLKSHRQMAIAALPRTGLPPAMDDIAEYEEIVGTYCGIGAISDASELRWDIRPSAAYPTIELRICDICPKRDDAVAIGALYACLIRSIATEVEAGRTPAPVRREIVEENRWLAQHYGSFALMMNGPGENRQTVGEMTEALVEGLAPDAAALECEENLEHAVRIGRDGTNAERQEDTYREAKLEGASES